MILAALRQGLRTSLIRGTTASVNSYRPRPPSSSTFVQRRAYLPTTALRSGPSRLLDNMAHHTGNFELVKRVDLSYAPGMSIEKWRSKVTGLTVYWADFESPLLNCYCTIASEIFNDSGVPHTLEHLIFLGSEQYPYKGMLDTLANRAFAQGTNAWTAQDHTAYTLTTAGSDGFLRMLPIYLDHVFHPTLTDEGFVTEVYHVNGKGEDAGVVFSEMQGRENGSGDLMELHLQRRLYPKQSAYRSETGGLMAALRVLTIDEIRTYHHTYYEPYNTALVVCGPLDRAKLFESVQPVEHRLVQKGVHGAPKGWKRPFLETPSAVVPSLKKTRTVEVVEFPEKDESIGEVMVTWIGPQVDDFETSEAISLLGTYLTDSAVSPVQQAFVEREDPLCTDVYFSTTDKAGATTVEAFFSSVPTEQIQKLDAKLVDEVLKDVVTKGIDMGRMKTLISRERVKLLNMLETKPADAFGDVIINDFLYGTLDGSDLEKSLDEMRRFDTLDTYSSEKWIGVLQKYLIDNPRLVISGKPSAKLSDKLKQDTKDLVAKRKAELGEDGLKRLDEVVKKAQKANDVEIPTDVLTNFKIPDVSSINWIGVGVAEEGKIVSRNGSTTKGADGRDTELAQHLQKTASNSTLPFFVQFSNVRSNFLTLAIMFDTRPLPAELKPLISLLLGSIWSLPVKRADGSHLPYEAVVKGLDEDTLEYDAALGFGSGFAEMVAFEVKVESDKYDKGINWLRDIIWQTELAVERIRVSVSKIAQSLPEQRRNGQMISWALARTLTHSEDLSANINNAVLKQSDAIPQLVSRLSTEDGAKEVLGQLAQIREVLFQPQNMIVNVAGDILRLPDPHQPLAALSQDLKWTAKRESSVSVPLASQVLTPIGVKPSRKGLITPLSTIESSFAVFSAKGIASWQEKDSAALAVTVSILNALESYLWRYIRGAGLAYGASIRSDIESQLIHFTLYRSPDSAKAFSAAADVVGKLVRGEMDMDQTVLDSAKSSLCFSVADSQGTPGSAAAEAFTDTVLRDLPKGRGRRLLEDARGVSLDDVRRCLATYIQPIFDPATSICAVASSPARVEEISAALERLGYEMEKRELNYGDEEEGSSGSEEGESESGDESDESEDRAGTQKQKL